MFCPTVCPSRFHDPGIALKFFHIHSVFWEYCNRQKGSRCKADLLVVFFWVIFGATYRHIESTGVGLEPALLQLLPAQRASTDTKWKFHTLMGHVSNRCLPPSSTFPWHQRQEELPVSSKQIQGECLQRFTHPVSLMVENYKGGVSLFTASHQQSEEF